jgi:hypothetical protein
MRQWVGTLLLAGMAAAPGLRTWCEIRCAAEDHAPAAAAKPHCHETAPSNAPFSFGVPDSCGDHAADPALVTSEQSRRFASPAVAAVVALMTDTPLTPSPVGQTRRWQHGTSPPIPPGSDILRI